MRTIFCLSCFTFLLLIASVNAQTTVATTREEVISEVTRQLQGLTASGGGLAVYCGKEGITGQYVVDLTIAGKGHVVTVFMVSGTAEDVHQQNKLKTKLSETKFENIKLRKNERIKFRYTLLL